MTVLSIGAFARIGQVTHRMLRHWDLAGLLVPAHISPVNGYRSYDPAQLERLHRIVALRQLGFGIEDISSLLQEGVDADQLREMLRRRRVEVERQQRVAAARLADVELRLRRIDKEKPMSTAEIVQKSLPALRLAVQTAQVDEQPEIAGVVGPFIDSIAATIAEAGGRVQTPMAVYNMGEEGIDVAAGFTYDGDAMDGFEVVTLPAEETAFVAVHLGAMDRIHESWQALHEAIIARGYRPSGPCREFYLRSSSEEQTDWVTELQQPVHAAGEQFLT